MNYLVIYDNEGRVIFTTDAAGNTENSFKPTFVDVPAGKILVAIDTKTQKPIFEDIPKSEIEILKERLEYQEEVINQQNAALIEVFEFVLGGNK